MKKFTKWIDVFLCVVILSMSAVVMAQIVSRYIFSKPLVWTEEVARIFLVWVTLVGGGITFISGDHIAIELINFRKGSIPYFLQFIMQSFCLSAIAVICVLYGYKMVVGEWNTLLPATRFSSGLCMYGGVVILGLLMLVRLVISIIGMIRETGDHKKEG